MVLNKLFKIFQKPKKKKEKKEMQQEKADFEWQELKIKHPEAWVTIYKEANNRKLELKIKAKNLDKYIPLGWKIKKVNLK